MLPANRLFLMGYKRKRFIPHEIFPLFAGTSTNKDVTDHDPKIAYSQAPRFVTLPAVLFDAGVIERPEAYARLTLGPHRSPVRSGSQGDQRHEKRGFCSTKRARRLFIR